MGGGHRIYERLLLLEDGRSCAPPCRGWDLFERLPDPITHYLRQVGTRRLAPPP